MYTTKYQHTYTFRGKKINSSFGVNAGIDFIQTLRFIPIKLGIIPKSHEFRPDLVSYTFFQTPFLVEEIMLVNNFFDPFDSLKAGSIIKTFDTI